jgi:hypothetical protein
MRADNAVLARSNSVLVIIGSTFFGLASRNLSPPCAFIIKSAFGTPKSFVWPQCDSKKLRFQNN